MAILQAREKVNAEEEDAIEKLIQTHKDGPEAIRISIESDPESATQHAEALNAALYTLELRHKSLLRQAKEKRSASLAIGEQVNREVDPNMRLLAAKARTAKVGSESDVPRNMNNAQCLFDYFHRPHIYSHH